MACIHLIEGPVGAGKSTYAAALSRKLAGIHLDLDDWMTILFSPDRPDSGIQEWYLERKQRCIHQIWKTAQSILAVDIPVILELGLIQQAQRRHFFQVVAPSGAELKIYILDASIEVRRQRVRQRNLTMAGTYSMQVPDHIFEMASELWEPLDQSETLVYEVTYISTESSKPGEI